MPQAFNWAMPLCFSGQFLSRKKRTDCNESCRKKRRHIHEVATRNVLMWLVAHDESLWQTDDQWDPDLRKGPPLQKIYEKQMWQRYCAWGETGPISPIIFLTRVLDFLQSSILCMMNRRHNVEVKWATLLLLSVMYQKCCMIQLIPPEKSVKQAKN